MVKTQKTRSKGHLLYISLAVLLVTIRYIYYCYSSIFPSTSRLESLNFFINGDEKSQMTKNSTETSLKVKPIRDGGSSINSACPPQQTSKYFTFAEIVEQDGNNSCSIAKNIVLDRADGVAATETSGPGIWSLYPGMFEWEVPPCRNHSSLLESVRYGNRSYFHNSSDPKKPINYRADKFQPYRCAPKTVDTVESACAVAGRFAAISLIGDSLSRHWVHGLMMMLRGDFVYGAYPYYLEEKFFNMGRCDGQFSEHQSVRVEKTEILNSWQNRMCYDQPSFKVNIPIDQICFNDPRPRFIALQSGPHFNSNPNATVDGFIKPAMEQIRKMKQQCQYPLDIHLIWSGLNSQSALMDQKFPQQSRPRALEFNEITESYMGEMGVRSINFVELSRGAATSDGYHMLSEANVFKALYLLEYMKFVLEEDA